MKRDNEAYERVYKYCGVCNRRQPHIVESTVTTCEVCHETRDDDAEDLFGEIE